MPGLPVDEVLAGKVAELEALREAQEVREVHLLEREESLRTLQAHLDSHVQQFAQVRRTLALDQARCFALMERRVSKAEAAAGGCSQGPESFSLDGGTGSPPQPRVPSRRPEPLYQQHKQSVSLQEFRTPPTSNESLERSNTDTSVATPAQEAAPGEHDVWDMDWTLPRTLTGDPVQEPDEPAKEPPCSEAHDMPAEAELARRQLADHVPSAPAESGHDEHGKTELSDEEDEPT